MGVEWYNTKGSASITEYNGTLYVHTMAYHNKDWRQHLDDFSIFHKPYPLTDIGKATRACLFLSHKIKQIPDDLGSNFIKNQPIQVKDSERLKVLNQLGVDLNITNQSINTSLYHREKGYRGTSTTSTKSYILPLSCSDEELGKTIIEAIQYIEDHYTDEAVARIKAEKKATTNRSLKK